MSRLSPGPSNALVTTIGYLRDPFGSLLDAGRKYGDPFTWPTFLGKMVVAGDPGGVYPEPEQFRPERFLSREYGPFEYLPFGGGSRRCLGAAFAVYEMKLVLATVLRSHSLRLIRDVPMRAALRNTTVGPAATIEMAQA